MILKNKIIVFLLGISFFNFLNGRFEEKSKLRFQETVFFYQAGSKLNFLYSLCNDLLKSRVEKDRSYNVDSKNQWVLINPNKFIDKKEICYQDEVLLCIISEGKYYILYASKDNEYDQNNNPSYYLVYTQEKKYMTAEELKRKWGVFKVVNPFNLKDTGSIDLNKHVFLSYQEDGFTDIHYLSGTASLKKSPEIWSIKLVS